jgi:hypothetical protein
MDVLKQLIAARELIAKQEGWCTFFLKIETPAGLAFCARGAIQWAIAGCTDPRSNSDYPACEELIKDIPEAVLDQYKFTYESPSYYNESWFNASWFKASLIADYNNIQGHAAVLALYDATIARLKREKVVADLLAKNLTAPAEGSNLSIEVVN